MKTINIICTSTRQYSWLLSIKNTRGWQTGCIFIFYSFVVKSHHRFYVCFSSKTFWRLRINLSNLADEKGKRTIPVIFLYLRPKTLKEVLPSFWVLTMSCCFDIYSTWQILWASFDGCTFHSDTIQTGFIQIFQDVWRHFTRDCGLWYVSWESAGNKQTVNTCHITRLQHFSFSFKFTICVCMLNYLLPKLHLCQY